MSQRQRNHGVRKVCSCSRDSWDTCDHPWHFNFKPRHAKPPKSWLTMRNRKGQKRIASQWPGYRYSLNRFFNRHVTDRADAEQLADKLRAMIVNKQYPIEKRTFSYTYLVSDPPFVKIGRTSNLEKRWPRKGVTDNPRDLTVLDAIAKDVEDLMHAQCEQFHHRGEWFHDVPQVRQAFATIKASVGETGYA